MTTDSKFFSVHLQSLESFAQELQTQLDGLRAPLDRLAVLTQQDLALGSFGEAYGLGTHHARIAEQMYTLMQAVRQAVGFAGEVTNTVVTSYQKFDQQSAAALGTSGAVQLGTSGAVQPGITGVGLTDAVPPGSTGAVQPATVQPVAVQVALSQPADVQITGPNLPADLPVTVTRQQPPPFTYSVPPGIAATGG
jgi:hypothetical protein